LLCKVCSKGLAPKSAIQLLKYKYRNQDSVKGIIKQNLKFFVTMEIDRKFKYTDSISQEYEVDDK